MTPPHSLFAPDHRPLLFPAVREFERLGGTVRLPDRLSIAGDVGIEAASAATGMGTGLEFAPAGIPVSVGCTIANGGWSAGSPERYELSVRERGGGPLVEIVADGRGGVLHGLSTLRQLIRQYRRVLPAVVIRDEPAFEHRGVMLDVSRDRVPRMDELLRVVDQIAELKFNHLQLYTEHTFAYAGHEEVWSGWSPMTADEVRRLDAYCRLRGVTLAANQNCFGHLASWLKLPRYAPLAEIQGAETAWKFYEYERRGPFSLCPGDPGSIGLVQGMLDQMLPCFSSGLVNINCDETADVGQGRSRGEVERRGAAAVYFEFITRVAEAVRERNFRPMFWADIALSHPEAVGLIPPDMVALAWGYEPDSPFGEWCKRLCEAGREAWVCPGTSSWRSITGRTEERRANIGAAVRDGLGAGAKGFLVTDWGDVGHRQQWPVSLHGIAHGADAAWSGRDGATDLEAESLQVLGDESLRVAAWLEELGDADLSLRRVGGRVGGDGSVAHVRNASVLFNDMHPPFEGADRKGTVENWRLVEERLGAAEATRPTVSDSLLADELRHTLDVARFSARRGVARRTTAGGRGAGERLTESLGAIVADHRRLWLARSRPGGLESSCRHYSGLLEGLGAL